MARVILVFSVLMAGLLGFVAQPILAKFTLPVLGGGGGVWTLVSIAFQGGLFLGYCYALFLLSLPRLTQLSIHVSLGAGSFVMIYFFSGIFGDVIQPWIVWTGIGLSYFLLSSTTPLVQGWVSGRMPVHELKPVYRLFSYSNIAAIVGLFAYPFFLEPELGWNTQIKFWSLFYFLYLCAILFVAYRVCSQRDPQINSRKDIKLFFYWLILPAVSTSYLLSMSFAFSQNIPPSPLIWVVPLSLYLLSYAVAFAGWVGTVPKAILFCLMAVFVSWLFFRGTATGGLTWEMFPVHCVVFFAGCLLLHGMLFDSRPDGSGLPMFYAAMAAGGFSGGLFSLLLVPVLFPSGDEIWLFHLTSGILPVTGLFVLYFNNLRGWGELSMATSFAVIIFLVGVSDKGAGGEGLNKRVRNFHGAFKVMDTVGWTMQRDLVHGGTAHGSQSLVIGEGGLSTTYYTRHSGIGSVAAWFRQKNTGSTILCIGVGTGTVATWTGSNDSLCFIDIDKDMIEVAQEDFSYIKDAKSRGARVSMIHGDGRISIKDIPPKSVDFFILDAFNGGGIPTHLLTTDAMREYGRVLKNSGIMVIHVSSRSLNLSGVVAGGMSAVGLTPAVLESDGGGIGTPSIWVVGSLDTKSIREIKKMHMGVIPKTIHASAWTDDFSSIYKLFK